MNQAFICYNVTAYEFGGRVEKVAKYPTYRTFFTHTVRLFIPLWFLTGPVFFATNQLSRGLNNVDSALSEVFIQRRVYSHIYTHDYCEYHSRVNFRRRNARLKDAQNRLTSWGLLHSHLDLLSFKNKKLKFSNKNWLKIWWKWSWYTGTRFSPSFNVTFSGDFKFHGLVRWYMSVDWSVDIPAAKIRTFESKRCRKMVRKLNWHNRNQQQVTAHSPLKPQVVWCKKSPIYVWRLNASVLAISVWQWIHHWVFRLV